MNIWDIEELAAYMVSGNDESKVDQLIDDGQVEILLEDEFGIGLDTFAILLETLIKYTPVLESPLTKYRYHCFGTHEKTGVFKAIIKKAEEGK